VFLTAYSDTDTLNRAKAVHPHGYLLKPSTTRALRSAVEVALVKHEWEGRMRESRHWFDAALRAIPTALFTLDLRGRVVSMNPAALRMVQRQLVPADVRFADLVRLVDELTGTELDLSSSLPPPGKAFHAEGILFAGTPSERVVECTSSTLFDETGVAIGAIYMLRDVTETRSLRADVAWRDRVQHLANFAAGIAHEINNPLTYVLGNLARVRHKLEGYAAKAKSGTLVADVMLGREFDGMRQGLSEALDGVDRIRGVVRDVVRFARPIEGPELSGANPLAALDWSMRVTNHLFSSDVTLEPHLHLVPVVVGTDGRLSQVFVNLLVSAAQAVKGGESQERRVIVRCVTEGSEVVVSIEDSGPGMDPYVMDRIFDPFFSTRPPGSGIGLGLTVARAIVESSGGRISVESKVGRGSVFRVHLPIASPSVLANGVSRSLRRGPEQP
jgi:signal transduction histidine kinase